MSALASIGPMEVVLLGVLLLLWLLPALLVGRFAESRGRSFALFFLTSLVISWAISLVVLLILGQRGTPDEAPTPVQPVGAWGVTPGDDSFAGEHESDRSSG